MSRAMALFRAITSAVKPPDDTNRDDFPSYVQTPEHDFVQTLLTNTLGNTFYVERGTLLEEANRIHRTMVAADPELAAKAIVYARNNGFMRTQPLLALAHLSIAHPAWFRRAFDGTVRTPNDLADFTVMVQSLREKPRTFVRGPKGGATKTVTAVTRSEGGAAVKKAAGRWMASRLSEFWGIKYGSARKDGPTIWDMVRMYHPKLREDQLPVVRYLKDGTFDAEVTRQIGCFEALKRARTDEEKIRAIVEGRLPHEVATSFAGSSKVVWRALIDQMPVFALLRHLATLERHGVLEDARDAIARKLQSQDAIARSKILPYRFIEAAKHVKAAWAKDALRDALELSFVNVPDIPGTTSVLIDCSPSMKPQYRSDGFMEIAAIFGVAAMKKGGMTGSLICFDGTAERIPLSMRDSTLTQARTVASWGSPQGGTNPSAALDLLLSSKERCDNLIVITDGQQNQGRPFAQSLAEYRSRVNREARCFVMDVSPYRNAITASDPTVTYVYGWSDRALDFIAMASQGWGTVVDHIRNSSLGELSQAETRHID